MNRQELESIINKINEGNADDILFMGGVMPVLTSIIINGNDYLCINGYYAFPIIVNKSYDTNNEIEVIDENANIIGYIYFSNDNQIIMPSNMSARRYAAYLMDVTENNFRSRVDMQLTKDYLVVDANRLSDYITYYNETSAIWGSFYQENNAAVQAAHKQQITQIIAYSNLVYPTIHHEKPVIHAIQQPFAFERFLKTYHLLELLFDWLLIEAIKNLGTDIYEAGKLIADYRKDEIDRLFYVLEEKIGKNSTDLNNLVQKINAVSLFPTQAKDIFYKYTKDNNPLKLENTFEAIINSSSKFEYQNVKKNIPQTGVQSVDNHDSFKKFLLKLSAYWIYRVRCCIAHHRLGEYLLKPQDEPFIVEFAEPLLNEILLQCFRR